MSAPHVGPAWISEVNEVSMVLSIISITLSCIAILSFIIFPERRRFPVRLPMYICISALGLALFSLFSSESMCRAQALGIYYFGTSTWVSQLDNAPDPLSSLFLPLCISLLITYLPLSLSSCFYPSPAFTSSPISYLLVGMVEYYFF